jgi:hypothetical protein
MCHSQITYPDGHTATIRMLQVFTRPSYIKLPALTRAQELAAIITPSRDHDFWPSYRAQIQKLPLAAPPNDWERTPC